METVKSVVSGILRRCCRCKRELPLTAFAEIKKRHGDRKICCLECNRQSHKDHERIYRENNREKVTANYRAYHLKRLYGITLTQYNEILLGQGGACAICGGKETKGRSEHFHVDHDHATGKIRGLLCSGCNQGLGQFCDDTNRLRLAIRYLEDSCLSH